MHSVNSFKFYVNLKLKEKVLIKGEKNAGMLFTIFAAAGVQFYLAKPRADTVLNRCISKFHTFKYHIREWWPKNKRIEELFRKYLVRQYKYDNSHWPIKTTWPMAQGNQISVLFTVAENSKKTVSWLKCNYSISVIFRLVFSSIQWLKTKKTIS